MNELTLHPNVYATGRSTGLVSILERVWVREHKPGEGTLYVVSGFANYNGGVRFYETFRDHVTRGGELVAIFSGSTRARLTSKQVVEEMLGCGAKVHLVNRKRLMHAKCYGVERSDGNRLVVSSGNFTGPGMNQNVEMAVMLDPASTSKMGFSWQTMIDNMLAQTWDYYVPTLVDMTAPAWQLLYDEHAAGITLDETDEMTMVLTLGLADTRRINAPSGSSLGLGSQYFWLSRDTFDFFPPLTIRNRRGHKATYSCKIQLRYVDFANQERESLVTFEAENNLDFRLGTGLLRNTGAVQEGDMMALTRITESTYELRLYRAGTPEFRELIPYAVNFTGSRGKKYGLLPNSDFERILGIRLPRT